MVVHMIFFWGQGMQKTKDWLYLEFRKRGHISMLFIGVSTGATFVYFMYQGAVRALE